MMVAIPTFLSALVPVTVIVRSVTPSDVSKNIQFGVKGLDQTTGTLAVNCWVSAPVKVTMGGLTTTSGGTQLGQRCGRVMPNIRSNKPSMTIQYKPRKRVQ